MTPQKLRGMYNWLWITVWVCHSVGFLKVMIQELGPCRSLFWSVWFYSAAEKDPEDDNGLQLKVQNIALLQDIQMPFWDALTGIKYRKRFFYSAWH